jgi:transcriptional regulator with XRE-family HTH domain
MRTDQRYELLQRLLIDARTKAGLKQADVAERLGRPQSYISKIERGERSLDVIEFMEIVKVIGFDSAAFYESSTNRLLRLKELEAARIRVPIVLA